MLRSQFIAALVLLLLASGCDSADPDVPESSFEATLLDGQGQTSSMEGTAQLNPGGFDQGDFLAFPFDGIEGDRQMTFIHLIASEGEAGRTIDFVHIGDDRPAPGEVLPILASARSVTSGEVSSGPGAVPNDDPERPDELTVASYYRATSDSLFMYLPSGGELRIERSSDSEMTGTFIVEIAAMRVAPLDERPPSDSDPVADPEDFSSRFELFADPLVLEGSFTAVPPEE